MVMRYYGSKDGLFAAAVDVELDLPDLAAADPATVGALLTRQFLALWERPPTDEILLLHHGQVRERGTHRELMALGGLYERLYRLQAGTDAESEPTRLTR